MRVLVHVCCGPCSIAVLQWLREVGHEATGFFFNPNIQPLAEYMRRREGAQAVHEKMGVPLLLADTLPHAEQLWYEDEAEPHADGTLDTLPPAVHPVYWARYMHQHEFNRCPRCWELRLKKTAGIAKAHGYDAITSTLLYSRYQNHGVIKTQAENCAAASGLSFVYHDFRVFWQQGISESKALGIYRQQYCGCMYSEYARYAKQLQGVLAATPDAV